MSPFARGLLDIAIEEGNTTSLENIRNAALSKMAAGDITTISSFTVNGKSSSINVTMGADKMFEAAAWAIREFNVGNITSTRLDFSLLGA